MNHERTINALVAAVDGLLDYAGRGTPGLPPGSLARSLRDALTLADDWDRDARDTRALRGKIAKARPAFPRLCLTEDCSNSRTELAVYCNDCLRGMVALLDREFRPGGQP